MVKYLIFILEVLGTAAFSVSGALIAIGCNLDLLGVVFVGCTTAVGGGILRDLLIGINPPNVFRDPTMMIIAAITAMVVFVVAYINAKRFSVMREKIEPINNIFDAVGLSAFTVTGTEIALSAGLGGRAIFCILMGMITGVGGGIFRDVLVNKAPYVLTKHVYALASIIGATIYYIMRIYGIDTVIAGLVSMIAVVTIRMLATRFHWKLPKIHVSDDK